MKEEEEEEGEEMMTVEKIISEHYLRRLLRRISFKEDYLRSIKRGIGGRRSKTR